MGAGCGKVVTAMKTKPIEDLDAKTRRLAKLAVRAQKRAYAPYSSFRVGCVIVDEKGRLHSGCNVENSSYSATVCAERAAIFKMVSRGGKKIRRLVLVTGAEQPVFPCGVCLQVIGEFGGQCSIVALNDGASIFKMATFAELFPSAFTKTDLGV